VLEKLPFKVEVIQTDHGRSSAPSSTTTSWIEGSGTSTSSRPRRCSTGRWRGPTGSTRRSSTGCWKSS
jgi:hypothetical protein